MPLTFENVRQGQIAHLKSECYRLENECGKVKETNAQLTRKLSASLKNKVELEKVQAQREQVNPKP